MAPALTHIRDLIPDGSNRRQRTPRSLGMIVDALQKVGASRSIVVDENGVILAGNGVVEAASEAGITKVQIVEADGETLVAVRRRGLTEAQKRALAIYDNRTGELAEWNVEQLAADLRNGEDLSAFFYEDELKVLLADADGVKAGLTDPDEIPQERPTAIVAGDLFELGAHRLLCGDATAQGDVARLLGDVVPFLMVTDPPYGVNYDPDQRGTAKTHGAVTGDHQSDWRLAWELFRGDVAYVWHASLKSVDAATSLVASGFEIRSMLVWVKPYLTMSRGHYHWQHEPCWYVVRGSAESGRWCGDRKQTTVINATQPGDPYGRSEPKIDHPTQKPIECMLRPMRNHDAPVVYEPFAGSGTTLMAAEQLTRACLAVEIEPKYCQVIIDRWEAFTGQTAVKVGEAVHA